jgi:hypothetical protein
MLPGNQFKSATLFKKSYRKLVLGVWNVLKRPNTALSGKTQVFLLDPPDDSVIFRTLGREYRMRISSWLILACLLLSLSTRLTAQTAVEYGTVTAASTAGATTDAKISGSIKGVFDRLSKGLDGTSTGQQGHKTAAAKSAGKPIVSRKGSQPAAASAAKPEASRILNRSQIRTGMSREELLRAVGKPFLQTSGTDEGVFAETYMYQCGADTVTVILHDGKVTGVSPIPEVSVAAPAL